MKKLLIVLIASIVFCNTNAQENKIRISEITPVAFHTIEKLSNVAPVERLQFDKAFEPVSINHPPFLKQASMLSNINDPVVQTTMGNRVADTLLLSFEGVGNINNKSVPDTQGDVGPDHYVQIVNSSFAVWNKQGDLLFGPVDNITLWDGLGINTLYDFDAIVLYDHLADRWLITDVARGNASTKYYLLIGVSGSGDPLDSWNVWAYGFDELPDYPKYGVWPDGFYVTANLFEYATYNWLGAAVGVFDRAAMQAGEPDPSLILFNLPSSGDDPHADPFNILPADLDGNLPPEGTPNYLSYFKDDAWGFENDFLSVWECHVDWDFPENSSLQEIHQIITEPFDANLDNFNYITQPVTSRRLQSLGNKLMFSLKYRQFGNTAKMVANHTVNVNDNDHAGIRWYEMHKNNEEDWTIFQQGTYAPDSVHRWMGSIAIDELGNIALGYSVSDVNTYPSIRYTGRLVDDPLGEMTIQENEIVTGGGYQAQSSGGWGDYSMMTIDPVDNITFWYTQMYSATNSVKDWNTWIAAFKLASTTSVNNKLDNSIGTITIYPNPFISSVNIDYELQQPTTVQITLYNHLGKRVRTINKNQLKGKQKFAWNAEDLPAGIYFCTIKTRHETQTKKIIKF